MTPPTSRFITLDAGRFHYLDFGGDDLPPLILVHGTGLHAWTWLTHAEALRDEFHVLAFDHRGQGDSVKDAAPFHWGVMADDLAEFVRALGLRQPFAVGHSMGGATLTLAEGRHPGVFGRLVLLDPIIMKPFVYNVEITIDIQPMAAKTIKRRWVWDSPAAMIESYSRKLPFMRWPAAELRHYVEHGVEPAPEGGVRLKCPPAIEAACYLGGHATDPWPLLPNVRVPVLLARGTETDTAHVVDLPAIAHALPDARILDIPGAGHFIPMEKPLEVVEAVRAFNRLALPN